jgi:hypothetical protein
MEQNLKKGIPREEVQRGIEVFNRVMANSPEMRRKMGIAGAL